MSDYRVKYLLRLWRPASAAPGKSLPFAHEELAREAYDLAVASLDAEWAVQLREFDGPVVAERGARPFVEDDPGYRPCRCEDYPCCGH